MTTLNEALRKSFAAIDHSVEISSGLTELEAAQLIYDMTGAVAKLLAPFVDTSDPEAEDDEDQ